MFRLASNTTEERENARVLVVIEKAFADASAAAKTGRDSFMVDRIGVVGN